MQNRIIHTLNLQIITPFHSNSFITLSNSTNRLPILATTILDNKVWYRVILGVRSTNEFIVQVKIHHNATGIEMSACSKHM